MTGPAAQNSQHTADNRNSVCTQIGADRLARLIDENLKQIDWAGPFVVGVSGGGDSVALLAVAAQFFKGRVLAVTVDHGLRPEAADEALQVHDLAQSLGVSHTTLHWRGSSAGAGLQARARSARYRLLADFCQQAGTPLYSLPLLTAHTLDDQAETFLIRAAGQSGFWGLAGILPISEWAGAPPVRVLRPWLSVSRGELRAYLRQRDIAWVDEPSNDDLRFERIRARRLIERLSDREVDSGDFASAAGLFARVRTCAEEGVKRSMDTCVRASGPGWATLCIDHLKNLPANLCTALLRTVLLAYGGAAYPVSREALARLTGGVLAPGFKGATLGGCRLAPGAKGAQLHIGRDFGRMPTPAAPLRLQPGESGLWDNRFFVHVPADAANGVDIVPVEKHGRVDWRSFLPCAWMAPSLPAYSENGEYRCLVGDEQAAMGGSGRALRAKFVGIDRVDGRLADAYVSCVTKV